MKVVDDVGRRGEEHAVTLDIERGAVKGLILRLETAVDVFRFFIALLVKWGRSEDMAKLKT